MSAEDQLISLIRSNMGLGGARRKRARGILTGGKKRRNRGRGITIGGRRPRKMVTSDKYMWVEPDRLQIDYDELQDGYLIPKKKSAVKREILWDPYSQSYVSAYKKIDPSNYFERVVVDEKTGRKLYVPKKANSVEGLLKEFLQDKLKDKNEKLKADLKGDLGLGGRRKKRMGRGLIGGFKPRKISAYQRHMKKAMRDGYSMEQAAGMWRKHKQASGLIGGRRKKRMGRGGLGISRDDLMNQIALLAADSL